MVPGGAYRKKQKREVRVICKIFNVEVVRGRQQIKHHYVEMLPRKDDHDADDVDDDQEWLPGRDFKKKYKSNVSFRTSYVTFRLDCSRIVGNLG